MLLRKYVKEELFKDKEHKPSELDRSFYPLDRDITNHIHLAIARQKTSNIDQEELINRIEKWKAEDPNSSYFFRPYSWEDNATESEKNVNKNNLLFVHQEEWQKVLLQKYGQQLFLMDATYKTMKYNLPLFFLCEDQHRLCGCSTVCNTIRKCTSNRRGIVNN